MAWIRARARPRAADQQAPERGSRGWSRARRRRRCRTLASTTVDRV